MSPFARYGLALSATVLLGACGGPAASSTAPSPTATGIPSPTGNNLPPCQTITATGCDPSALQSRGRGSSACLGKGPGIIAASPIALNDLAYIQPMGLMIGGHVTPIGPRWGKIDYDIDGKLVGNWFRVGSGGYAGQTGMREGYWDGHLAVVYDGNDPGQIDISFGNYQGAPRQFAVIGNAPDPAVVDISTGLVRYELGQIQTYSETTGQPWSGKAHVPDIRTRAAGPAQGTVLMQLMATRSLKLEIFPGETAGQVAGFDSGAVMFER
jgi:hypothetical protein